MTTMLNGGFSLRHALDALGDDTDVTKTLSLARTQMSVAQTLELALAIEGKSGTLASIDLRDCGITGAGCVALCKAAGQCIALRELRLCGNDIQDAGCTAAAELLTASPTLAKLELKYCKLETPGCSALCEAIGASFSLEELTLSGNPLSDATARVLAESLKATISLTKLSLADTALQVTGCKILCEAAAKSPLVELNLQYNRISQDMMTSIAQFLSVSSRVTRLNLHSCGIDTDGLVAMAEGVRSGPQRRGILKLIGVDLSVVVDRLQLPEKEDVEWNTETILDYIRQLVEDRDLGLGTRPPTRGSSKNGDGIDEDTQGDEEGEETTVVDDGGLDPGGG